MERRTGIAAVGCEVPVMPSLVGRAVTDKEPASVLAQLCFRVARHPARTARQDQSERPRYLCALFKEGKSPDLGISGFAVKCVALGTKAGGGSVSSTVNI